MFHVPECYRVVNHPWGVGEGNNGPFLLPAGWDGRSLFCLVSDGLGWEHVSVHAIKLNGRPAAPTWDEMCRVKDAFWGSEDAVMQLHPRRSQYRNDHEHTLHLWRPNDGREIPEPEAILVGVKAKSG